MENESMVFYKSFYEAIRGLQTNIKAELYDAIVHYGLYEEDLQLSEKAMPYYILIKPQLIANLKRRKAGVMGGRPKKETLGYENECEKETIGFENDKDNKTIGYDFERKSEKPNEKHLKPNVNVNVNNNIKKNIKKKNSKKTFGSFPQSEIDYGELEKNIYAN